MFLTFAYGALLLSVRSMAMWILRSLCRDVRVRVVNDTFQKYRRYSISIPVLKVSSIPISILFLKSIDRYFDIDTFVVVTVTL